MGIQSCPLLLMFLYRTDCKEFITFLPLWHIIESNNIIIMFKTCLLAEIDYEAENIVILDRFYVFEINFQWHYRK